jgi:hypothetical protein
MNRPSTLTDPTGFGNCDTDNCGTAEGGTSAGGTSAGGTSAGGTASGGTLSGRRTSVDPVEMRAAYAAQDRKFTLVGAGNRAPDSEPCSQKWCAEWWDPKWEDTRSESLGFLDWVVPGKGVSGRATAALSRKVGSILGGLLGRKTLAVGVTKVTVAKVTVAKFTALETERLFARLYPDAIQIAALAGEGESRRTVATGITESGVLVATSTTAFTPLQRKLLDRLGYTAVEAVTGFGIHAEINLIAAVESNAALGKLIAVAAHRGVCEKCAAGLMKLGILIWGSLKSELR